MTYPFPHGYPYPYGIGLNNNTYVPEYNTNTHNPLMGNFPPDPLSAQLFTQPQYSNYPNPMLMPRLNEPNLPNTTQTSLPTPKSSEIRKRKEPEIKETLK